jgi:hypothetical protein
MESLINLTVELDIVEGEEHWTVKKLEIVKTLAKPDILQLALPSTMIERMAGQVGGPNCCVVSSDRGSDGNAGQGPKPGNETISKRSYWYLSEELLPSTNTKLFPDVPSNCTLSFHVSSPIFNRPILLSKQNLEHHKY